MFAGSAQNHARGLSSVPCQHAAQDICQQKRHIPTATSFPSCPTHQAIFENSQATRMAGISQIIAWRKMVNKRHWYGSWWLGCRGEKCLEKAVWIACLDVVSFLLWCFEYKPRSCVALGSNTDVLASCLSWRHHLFVCFYFMFHEFYKTISTVLL